MITSYIGIGFFLFFIGVLGLSYTNNFNLKIENKKFYALVFPFVLTLMIFSLMLLESRIVIMSLIVFSLFLVFYYINDNESIFSYLYVKTAFMGFIVLFLLFIVGGVLLNVGLFEEVDDETSLIMLFFIGTYLFLLARFGFISLASQIVRNKNRNKFWGILGVIGIIGLFVVYLLPKVKDEA